MQFFTLYWRSVTNQFRSKQFGIFKLIPSVFTGIIFGCIYLSIPDNDQGVQSRAVRTQRLRQPPPAAVLAPRHLTSATDPSAQPCRRPFSTLAPRASFSSSFCKSPSAPCLVYAVG